MVKKLETALPPAPKRKRVAAYARVSMDSEQLMHSLSAQVSYYSDLIQKNPEWEYVGVYADEGITGTSTEHRDEFNRLMADCDAGKVDLILVKSISRFARNTVDCLNAVRHLKEVGVEVRFERENISTFSGEGEFMLTILASFAQEEAKSISDNVKWGIQKRFEQGIPNGHKRMLGYEWDGEKYVIVPTEAEIVKRIFSEYDQGLSSVQIAKGLNSDGLINIEGNRFRDSEIRFILDNVDYTGDLLLQKKYSPSLGKRQVNHGEAQKYLVEEAQEPIIDRKLFETVQEKRRKKAEEMPDKNISCFSGRLICGYCGSAVCRRNVSNGKPQWICNGQDHKGIGFCGGRRLPEPELIQAATEVTGCGYEEAFRKKQVAITVYDDRLEFHLTGDRTKIWARHFEKALHARGCFTKKIHCAKCGEIFTRERPYWICKNHRASSCSMKPIHEDRLIEVAQEIFGDNYEMKVRTEIVDIIVSDDSLVFIRRR